MQEGKWRKEHAPPQVNPDEDVRDGWVSRITEDEPNHIRNCLIAAVTEANNLEILDGQRGEPKPLMQFAGAKGGFSTGIEQKGRGAVDGPPPKPCLGNPWSEGGGPPTRRRVEKRRHSGGRKRYGTRAEETPYDRVGNKSPGAENCYWGAETGSCAEESDYYANPTTSMTSEGGDPGTE
ncbi:unnamed protein product, partial [Mesorhabditis spiculigera]